VLCECLHGARMLLLLVHCAFLHQNCPELRHFYTVDSYKVYFYTV